MERAPRVFVLAVLVASSFGIQAAELKPADKFLWSSYMICWPLERDYRGFKDRPLHRPPSDGTNSRVVDVLNAVEAGIDAFSVDLFIEDKHALPAFQTLVNIINARRLPLQLSPMFDGLGTPGVTVDAVVAKVQAWFEKFAQEPCVVRCGGKPVIFTFAAYALKPEQWRVVFDRLHAAGCDGYWIPELGRLLAGGKSPDLQAARPWLELFPTGNVFRAASPDRTRELIRLYRETYPSNSWVADVGIGYWRPEVAVYTSQNGTRLFRDSWRAVMDCGITWAQQSTWNDFSENHQIMPSENYSTTFADLNRHLAAQWKGKAEALDAPRLYLSQQQEALVGEEAEFELLALLRPQDAPASLELRVADAAGKLVKAFEPARATQPGLHPAEFKLAISELPSDRLLFPEGRLLDSAGKPMLTVQGPYTVVCPSGYRPERNYSWLHTPAHRQVSGVKCELGLDERGAVSVRVASPAELADVEVLHDGAQLLSVRREKKETKLASPFTWQGQLPLNRQGRLNWGAYAARAVTADGRVATSLPVLVERPAEADVTLGLWTFDADEGSDALDSSPWLHDGRLGGRPRRPPWQPQRVPDAWDGKCLQFDGVDDRVLLDGPIVPPNAYTVECWIKPEAPPDGSKGQILFATANAAVVLMLGQKGELRAVRRSSEQWHQVSDGKPIPPNQWQHVAVTYDGSVLRLYHNGVLVAEKPAPGDARCGQVSLGYNSVTEGAFYRGLMDEVRLSARALPPDEFGPHNPLSGRR